MDEPVDDDIDLSWMDDLPPQDTLFDKVMKAHAIGELTTEEVEAIIYRNFVAVMKRQGFKIVKG
jgi:hypothetical protein